MGDGNHRVILDNTRHKITITKYINPPVCLVVLLCSPPVVFVEVSPVLLVVEGGDALDLDVCMLCSPPEMSGFGC